MSVKQTYIAPLPLLRELFVYRPGKPYTASKAKPVQMHGLCFVIFISLKIYTF